MSPSQKLAPIIRLIFASLFLAMALAVVFRAASPAGAGRGFNDVVRNDIARTHKSQSQRAEKSLDINRYPGEPLEFVDLKIRKNSMKNGIKLKFKVPGSQNSFDHVKFNDNEDWFETVKLRLRNVSGKPIYDIGANLYFKPAGFRMLFQVPLVLAAPRNLKQEPLQPKEQIELEVNQGLYGPMIQQMRQYGVEPNEAQVNLSVDAILFADDLAWDRGVFMRRDPDKRNKWDAVGNTPSSPSAAEPYDASQLFQRVGLKLTNSRKVLNTTSYPDQCQQAPAGWDGRQCMDDAYPGCYSWTHWGNGYPGYYSNYPIVSYCTDSPSTIFGYCQTTTISYLLTYDFDCPPPGATPTPMSCLPNGWTYLGPGTPSCCSGHYDEYNTCGPASSTPTPTPTPGCGRFLDACFTTACCPGYDCYGGICMGSASPTPTPFGCFPNGTVCFSPGACCSGNCANFQCEPAATPLPCMPNGTVCFSPGACCSGNCANFQCASASAPTPTPTPGCQPDGWDCFDDNNCCSGNCDYFFFECYSFGGPGGGDPGDWCYWSDCSCGSDWQCDTFCDWDGFCAWWFWLDPIVIDVNGDGFAMSDAATGVTFDFFGRGVRRRLSWTAAGSDDAWLVLDRNRNGSIENAKEMFSNVTPQPAPPDGGLKIGFAALAEYDQVTRRGNGDGMIDQRDGIFQYLRLWQDTNHNAISEPSELRSLPELGVESISLDYKESRRTDRWGNTFRYRAKVYGPNKKDLGRWAYDVVLLAEQRGPGRKIALDDSGQFPLGQIDVFRPSRPWRLGQIDYKSGRSLIRELSSAPSLLW